ncbi:MAG: SEC-C domain-containing protein, partial [Verrucomicrobiales bacterium]|nr:SEC-C domain-containing protein [Verrucomicrobiales bacterium]
VVRFLRTIPKSEGRSLEHPFLDRSVVQAQKRVEQHHYQGRRRTLDYDDVMNRQRDVIYGFRNEILREDDVRDRLLQFVADGIGEKVLEFTGQTSDAEAWDLTGLIDWVNITFPLGLKAAEFTAGIEQGGESTPDGWADAGLSPRQAAVAEAIVNAVRRAYDIKVSVEQPDALRMMERQTLLTAIDRQWREHLYTMDSLRTAISLRSYGQKDPLVEYKTEAHQFFTELASAIKQEVCRRLFLSATSVSAFQEFLRMLPGSRGIEPDRLAEKGTAQPSPASSDIRELPVEVLPGPKPVRTGPKVGRNDPCACGSGRKSKLCCGR